MKKATVYIRTACIVLPLSILALLIFAADRPDALGAGTASNKLPVAVMPETTFEFSPTMEGEKITHDFVIRNRGNADLTVLKVKTA